MSDSVCDSQLLQLAPGLQNVSVVLAGHHLWVPCMMGGHSFTDLFLPFVRKVHWEAEAVEDHLQEEPDELSMQIHVQPSPGPKAS